MPHPARHLATGAPPPRLNGATGTIRATMNNPHKGRTGLDRIVHAAGYSITGLASAYRHENAFLQETWLALVLLPLAFWLGRDWT